MSDPRPIAVIDSGLGGLCLVRAILGTLPAEQVIYFADTARQPYGARSATAITSFCRQIIRHIAQFNPKHVLLACNTATALSLDAMRMEFPDLPISGVIEPAARAAVEAGGALPAPVVGVMATEATIRSKAYERALARRRNKAVLLLRPAPLLVPIIEEGRDPADPLVRLALRQYLHPLMARKADVLILGCTHYAIYKHAIADIVGPDMSVIDASQRCADDVARRLRSGGRIKVGGVGSVHCLVSDDPQRFAMLASRLLGMSIDPPAHVPVDAMPSDQLMPMRGSVLAA